MQGVTGNQRDEGRFSFLDADWMQTSKTMLLHALYASENFCASMNKGISM